MPFDAALPRCAMCGRCVRQPTGAINRALRHGKPLYCDRECAGLARRKNLTKDEKKAKKRAYDIAYRAKNASVLKVKKHAYFKRTYDPEKAREERAAMMPAHVEYCRRPEYRAYKREYDRNHRAAEYADHAEAYKTLMELQREIQSTADRREISQATGTANKRQERRRAAGSECRCAKRRTMGDA